jgi:Fe-S oxidoreductase
MKVTKLQLRKIIREEVRTLMEAKVSTDVFVKKWYKAMKLAKSSKMWSPHMKAKDPAEAVGYTNSDFWDKVPDRADSIPVFGYHRQSGERAFDSGDWVDDLALGWGMDGDDDEMKKVGKDIVKVLKRAGFKVKWSVSPDKKIFLIPG